MFTHELKKKTQKNLVFNKFRQFLEYACAIRDLEQRALIDKLQKNKTARFFLGWYGRRDSCTLMKTELNWEPRRKNAHKVSLFDT